jgi:hypothetical protein
MLVSGPDSYNRTMIKKYIAGPGAQKDKLGRMRNDERSTALGDGLSAIPGSDNAAILEARFGVPIAQGVASARPAARVAAITSALAATVAQRFSSLVSAALAGPLERDSAAFASSDATVASRLVNCW